MKEKERLSVREEEKSVLLPSSVRSQAKAQELFEEGPFPQRKTETWRFGDVRECDFWQYPFLRRRAGESPDEAASFLSAKTNEACVIPVYNGEMDLEDVELPEGVSIFFLEDLEKKNPQWADFLEESFALPRQELGSEKVTAWIQAQAPKTTVIHLREGVLVPYPLHLAHQIESVGEEKAVAMAHTLIWAEKGAQALVLESWEDKEKSSAVLLSHLSCVLKPEAKVHYASLQALSQKGRAVQTFQSHIQAGGHMTSLLVNTGADWVRQENWASLLGKQAQARLFATSLAQGQQRVDQRTYQDHVAPHALSDLLYKNTLRDKASTVFSGMIRVGEGAHFSDAFQRCHNRLLSSEAEAYSLPGLEILADEVKCSHGATNGGMSEEELFYLLSRGISPSVARQLLAQGFSAQVLEKFDEALSLELLNVLSWHSDDASPSEGRAFQEDVSARSLPATSYATQLAWELIEESFSS